MHRSEQKITFPFPKATASAAVALLGLFAAIPTAFAAEFSFSPQTGSFHDGENFTITVAVSTKEAMNAASGTFTFPTEYLEVLHTDTSRSIINLWLQEPSFSNATAYGNVTFEGVVLNPGFVGNNGTIFSVTFRVKKEGTANIQFTRSAILANDGLGTNLAATGGNARFTLLPPKAVQKPAGATTGATTVSTTTVVVVREVPVAQGGLIGAWEVLPRWVRILIIISVGLSTAIVTLIILSLGIIVLIWIWSNIWRKRFLIWYWLRMVPIQLRRASRAASIVGKSVQTEIKGDSDFALQELRKRVDEARDGVSLGVLIRDYLISLQKVVKRFLSWDGEQPPQSGGSDEIR